MDDAEERENELLALESILETDSFKITDSNGFLKVHPQLSSSTIIVSVEQKTTNNAAVNNTHVLSYLPPIALNFTLPSDYPSTNPPEFTLSCKWLTRKQLETLCLKLDDIWKENIGDVVLYNWFQFLENDALPILNIGDRLCIKQECNKDNVEDKVSTPSQRAVQDIRNYSEILPWLLMYNQSKINKRIRTSTFDCNICLDTRPGLQCIHLLGCDHVYCKVCLSSYCRVNVSEGSVRALICPEPTCKTQLLPNQVKELVSSELYDRYEKLMLQTTLDTMTDIMYCPLPHCQSAVIVEPESTVAQCPSCSYAFCPYCRLSYHGVSPCKMLSGEIKRLCEEYQNGSPEKRKKMEKKYGRKPLQKAIEDSQNQEWLNNNAKACPGCKARIEKSEGCNKMTCYKCRAYFCWLCMSTLSGVNPYMHYNRPGNSCYNRLFEGVDIIDIDDEEWFF